MTQQQIQNVVVNGSSAHIAHPQSLAPALNPQSINNDQKDTVGPLNEQETIDVLSLQVKAFLAAADDVDVDMETLQQLVKILEDREGNDRGVEIEGEDEEWLPGKDPEEPALEELDISALFSRPDEDDPWTPTEVKEMMCFLKERGMGHFVRRYVITREIPIPRLLRAFGINLCSELHFQSPQVMSYFLRVAMARELRLRDRLSQYNTIEDAVRLIRDSKRILILTGAGISVSCGIPDFRSRDGIYSQLGDYELDDPQQMFDINYFRENPAVSQDSCNKNVGDLGNAAHSLGWNFRMSLPSLTNVIEERNQLLRNYTQNIDTLETAAGVQRVLQCHGSFATASCLACRRKVPGKEIETEILRRRVPLCSVCNSVPATNKTKKKGKKKARGEWDSDDEDESDGPTYPAGIMKPDITFFGEKLTDEFDRSLEDDREKVDLLLVIGTSLKVAPVADILSHLPHSVPQILINKTPVRHINPDIILLGNADDIVKHLCTELGWDLPPALPPLNSSETPPSSASNSGSSTPHLQPPRGTLKRRTSAGSEEITQKPTRIRDSHVWLFSGAEGGKWLAELERSLDAQPVQPSSSDDIHEEEEEYGSLQKKARLS
ncbi:NAD-dependent histone deacetylase sir2 [Stygiomarasmius scandens]|uniref:NAD-dependent histone deacetylase sir2 n=1 Tax=Marasmiellus scandens TaxID=2682957 RepID=A0ABR1JWN0_9AGAR